MNKKTFEEIQKEINDLEKPDVIYLDGFYKGNGKPIIIDKDNLIIDGQGKTVLDAQELSNIFIINGRNVYLFNLKLINGKITKNGGAIQWNGNKGEINKCIFKNNSANRDGGAIQWCGEKGIIKRSIFKNNSAKDFGGAIKWESINGKVVNSHFLNNKSKYGGAIYWFGYVGDVENCAFSNNLANKEGNAIYWAGEGGRVIENKFRNNPSNHHQYIDWGMYKVNGFNCKFY